MVHPYNRNLKTFARELRKNLTDTERLLWSSLRRKQIKGAQFYKQKIMGSYIVDFYCPSAKLIIELDGGQHYTEEGTKADKIRDAYMESRGFKVLRFSDRDVIDSLNGVLESIYESL